MVWPQNLGEVELNTTFLMTVANTGYGFNTNPLRHYMNNYQRPAIWLGCILLLAALCVYIPAEIRVHPLFASQPVRQVTAVTLTPNAEQIKGIIEGKVIANFQSISWILDSSNASIDYQEAILELAIKFPGLRVPSSRREFINHCKSGRYVDANLDSTSYVKLSIK